MKIALLCTTTEQFTEAQEALFAEGFTWCTGDTRILKLSLPPEERPANLHCDLDRMELTWDRANYKLDAVIATTRKWRTEK